MNNSSNLDILQSSFSGIPIWDKFLIQFNQDYLHLDTVYADGFVAQNFVAVRIQFVLVDVVAVSAVGEVGVHGSHLICDDDRLPCCLVYLPT